MTLLVLQKAEYWEPCSMHITEAEVCSRVWVLPPLSGSWIKQINQLFIARTNIAPNRLLLRGSLFIALNDITPFVD